MKDALKTVSLIAERAVRQLRAQKGPLDSVRLARELLAASSTDEPAATRVLQAAFAGDSRLTYGRGGWRLTAGSRKESAEPDRALLFVEGARPGRGLPFQLHVVAVVRMRGEEVVAACGGEVGRAGGSSTMHLRRAVGEALSGALPVTHDPPGALRALEHWLGEPLGATISLRVLGQHRLGLPAGHRLEDLAARLGLAWRDARDPLQLAETLETCLRALREPGESWYDLHSSTAPDTRPIDWSRFAFDRSFLRRIPRVPGTYSFFDRAGSLLYIGKAKNLQARIQSYFREGMVRSGRVERLLERLHRIEYKYSGSELEAMLREAEQIRREKPEKNVQRHLHVREGRSARLNSILILEQAEPPTALRAYLIHHERLIAKIDIGPRGGGLRRIERVLDDHFFFAPVGPTPATGPDIDVEVVIRWLAANRDRVVAFDPTDLRSAGEVTLRLRWFLDRGGPFDPDGTPIVGRSP